LPAVGSRLRERPVEWCLEPGTRAAWEGAAAEGGGQRSQSHLLRGAAVVIYEEMRTAKEIEAAILALPPSERQQLVEDLPGILPELDGDARWSRIISDPRPRRALSALGDEIEARLKSDPNRFLEIKESDFD
jgi:hypothetical protein